MIVCNELDRDLYPKSKDCPLSILVCYHKKLVKTSNSVTENLADEVRLKGYKSYQKEGSRKS